jgi:hypothetical protein
LTWDQKKYTWESCFTKTAWFVNSYSNLQEIDTNPKGSDFYKNTVPTKNQAKAILALTQLITIVYTINKDYPISNTGFYLVYLNDTKLECMSPSNNKYSPLQLSKEGAEILIRDNKELLLEYFNNI